MGTAGALICAFGQSFLEIRLAASRIDPSDSEGIMATTRDERKAGWILAAIAATEGGWVVLNAGRNVSGFLRYTGFVGASQEILGWSAAAVAAVFFIAYAAAQLPSVRTHLFKLSGLKWLALLVAVTAGFCEEAVFRKLLMDTLAHMNIGLTLQIFGSAAAFGLAHGIWGLFRGSVAAGARATLATGVLGLALAVVFVISHRLLAPCIVAHVLINAFAEPGLVLAAVRGEMSVALATTVAAT